MSEEYIDWEIELGRLQDISELPDSNDLDALRAVAKNWKQDPAANLDEDLPGGAYGEPIDPVLKELSLLFGDYIDLMTDSSCGVENIRGLANGATIILVHIETRAKKVLDWVRRKS